MSYVWNLARRYVALPLRTGKMEEGKSCENFLELASGFCLTFVSPLCFPATLSASSNPPWHCHLTIIWGSTSQKTGVRVTKHTQAFCGLGQGAKEWTGLPAGVL